MRGLGNYAGLPDVALSFQYNGNNKRTQMSDPSGTTVYNYDPIDRLVSMTNPKGETFGFAYDDSTGGGTITRPGSQTTLAVDNAGFMTSLIHSTGGNSLSSFTLQRDLNGNLTQITTDWDTRNFAYNANQQLTSASYSSGPRTNETYNYDSIYNRTSDQGGAYTYDAKSQRLAEDYRYFYVYDNNGNLTSKQAKGMTGEVTNFSYTSENQLTGFKVYLPGNNQPVKEVSYAYDALGRRIQKNVVDHRAENDPKLTFTRRYIYDGHNVLLEYDGNNSVLARYTSSIAGDDILAADITSAGVNESLAKHAQSYFYLKDPIGSISDIADSSGNRVQHYIYSAFGTVVQIQNALGMDITSDPEISTSYAFAGRELDSESGYYYNRARYYDPMIGRFIQKDPEPGSLTSPASVVNGYIYGANNPVNFTDPTGRSIFSDLGDFFMMAIGTVMPVIGVIGVFDYAGRHEWAAHVLVGAMIVGAAAVTGGAAGPALAGLLSVAGAVGSTIAGALIGGTIAGTLNVLTGNGSFLAGFIQGALAGGLAAYSAASNAAGAGASESSAAGESAAQDGGGTQFATNEATRASDVDPVANITKDLSDMSRAVCVAKAAIGIGAITVVAYALAPVSAGTSVIAVYGLVAAGGISYLGYGTVSACF